MNPQEQQPSDSTPQESELPQWQYHSDAGAQPTVDYSATDTPGVATTSKPKNDASFAWQTIEYTEHQRSILWFLALFFGASVIAALTYLLTKDYIAVGTIAVVCVIVAVAASRKPRQIDCEVSTNGLRIDQKTHTFGQFKSFGVIREGALPTVELFPIKKFMPAVVVHFNAQDEQKITQIIGKRLPYEERKMASIDKLAHTLRF